MDNALPDTPDGFAIKTSALTRRFGNLTAADRIELNIPYGEIYGLLGANGAGKSTLIKMLTTLLSPTSGTAEVGGYDISKSPGEVRRRIGYVSQLVSADGALTGYENLRLSGKLYGLPPKVRSERIANALEFMGLAESSSRLVRTYSDRLLSLRHDYGMTVLITTHDMEEAETLSDELAIMHTGRISVVGKPAELRAALGAELGKDATMDDVFVHYAGGLLHESGSFSEVAQTRRTARRLG